MWRAILMCVSAVLICSVVASGWPSAQKAEAQRTVLDGVYTADQAAEGLAAYEAHCLRCHDGNDPEGPALVGRVFIDRWREDSLDVLFTHIKTRMPGGAPQSLSDRAYLNIVAFLLRENDYLDGARELATDELENIQFVGKDGAKPLPNNSLVLVVGCLAQVNTAWMLTDASEPSRTRQGDETTDEELRRSAAKLKGSLSYNLQNFVNLHSGVTPDSYRGHRVQVKGVLFRQPGNSRISMTSLQSVAETCAP